MILIEAIAKIVYKSVQRSAKFHEQGLTEFYGGRV